MNKKSKKSEPKEKVINQCDGCRRGLPLKDGKYHIGKNEFWGGDMQYCTKYLYQK